MLTEKKTDKKAINPLINFSQRPHLGRNVILIILLVLGLLLWKFKGAFIAAIVNGQPISRWQLNSQLEKKFGDQVLDNLINERLILSAIRQKGIFISTGEIDSRMKQIEGRLQGTISLDDALKTQGLSKDDFRRQIEIQLSIEKLFGNESTLSAKEVDDYYLKNKAAYKDATDTAAVKRDVENTLRQQKMADLFEKWFADVRKSANIQKFL
jgi:parvulin-like peptidyl-prolyl isomerase